MSRFLNNRLNKISPYVPGEQPRDKRYIKLNTNENPYPPSEAAVRSVTKKALRGLRLYSDPDCDSLSKAAAECFGVSKDCVLPTNGSDEALAFCFAAFCDCGAVFPDVTYGFYKVFADLFGVEYEQIPLDNDFAVNVQRFSGVGRTVFLANPNAQTGIYLDEREIERIVKSNKNNVVVIDEAYIDFGGKSAVGLIDQCDNLVVVRTLSKSRALAGARVGFALASKALTDDLKRVKFSFNPYNINSLSEQLAVAALRDTEYFESTCKAVAATRDRLSAELRAIGCTVLPSKANFVLAKSPTVGGADLYKRLKDAGILVRHFGDERIADFVRITVGTDEQTDILLSVIKNTEGV